MSQDKRSFLADFTDPDKIDFMAHFTPEQHRAWVALMVKARRRGFKRLEEHLALYQRTTRSVIMGSNTRVGSEQEVEVLRQHAEAVDRVEDPPEDLPSKGLFAQKKKRREVMVDGQER
jgi:hypothetical protein